MVTAQEEKSCAAAKQKKNKKNRQRENVQVMLNIFLNLTLFHTYSRLFFQDIFAFPRQHSLFNLYLFKDALLTLAQQQSGACFTKCATFSLMLILTLANL